MRVKPSMELPSIMIWLFRAFSSCPLLMETFFSWPKMSVNCMRMNSTFCSLTMRTMSSRVYLAICNFSLRCCIIFDKKKKSAVKLP